jgi:hypothetical protein
LHLPKNLNKAFLVAGYKMPWVSNAAICDREGYNQARPFSDSAKTHSRTTMNFSRKLKRNFILSGGSANHQTGGTK